MRKTTSGFTIIELLVVIVVIGILVTITTVSFRGIQQRARATASVAHLGTVHKALEQYYVFNDSYPTTNENWISQHDNATDFIPALVPDIISAMSILYTGAGGDWQNDVLYRSNGSDYKLLIHNDGLCNTVQSISPQFVDPDRKDGWNCRDMASGAKTHTAQTGNRCGP